MLLYIIYIIRAKKGKELADLGQQEIKYAHNLNAIIIKM